MGYNPIEDFQRKDLLESGDPDKIVRGTELQVEFDAISADLAKVRVEQENLNYLPITGGTVNGDISARKITATEFVGGTLSATNVSGTTFAGNGAALTGMKMSQLTDVKMTNVARDDVLIWNGSAWEASDVYDIVSPLTYAGILDVTQPAPTANNGDVFVNDQEGEAHPSFKGIAGVLILEGKFVIYDAPTDEWNSPGNSADGGVNIVKAGSGIEVDSIKPSEPVVSIDRSETDSWYEPVFSKNTGFNKDLGTAAGTVAEGNHLHSQYLENFTEVDPTVPAHVKAISAADITSWNTAYGWGDHGAEGYITSSGSITGNAATATDAENATKVYVKDYNGTTAMRLLGSHDGIASNGNVYGNAGITMRMDTDVITAGGGYQIGSSHLRSVGGDYGSFTVTGTKGGYAGINVNNRLVLMNDDIYGGLYDDTNNNWFLHCTENAGCKLYYNNQARISTTNAGVSVTGSMTASGNVTAYSDERLKDNVETLDGSKVYDMRGVSFTKDGEIGSGVIAQELQMVAPELVHEGEEYLSVAYGNLVGYLIEAVKDLKAEVEELKRVK